MGSVKMILAIAMAMLVGLLTFGVALADDKGTSYRVTVTNLTKKQVITPPLVISHQSSFKLFKFGHPASAGLAALAEGGNTMPLEAMLGTRDDVFDYMTGGGPILPGQSMTIMVQVKGNYRHLSLAGMLASSNDAFFALKGVRVSGETKTKFADAYDAGSEANTELCSDVPGPPCTEASGNLRVTTAAEEFVHVHNGIHGGGGLNAANMTWHNPVAKVVIKKMK